MQFLQRIPLAHSISIYYWFCLWPARRLFESNNLRLVLTAGSFYSMPFLQTKPKDEIYIFLLLPAFFSALAKPDYRNSVFCILFVFCKINCIYMFCVCVQFSVATYLILFTHDSRIYSILKIFIKSHWKCMVNVCSLNIYQSHTHTQLLCTEIIWRRKNCQYYIYHM